jgi:hypothetical protein
MTEAADFLATVARAQMRSSTGDWAEAELWAEVTAANPVNGDYWARLAEARFAGQELVRPLDNSWAYVLINGVAAP